MTIILFLIKNLNHMINPLPISCEDKCLGHAVELKSDGSDNHYVGTQLYHFWGTIQYPKSYEDNPNRPIRYPNIEWYRKVFNIYLSSNKKLRDIIKENPYV